MPFNRVTDTKAMVLWLLVLQKQEEDEIKTLEYKKDPTRQVQVQKVPYYIPGLMLIPIPKAGFILGHVDMAFWATFLYVVGSLFYVVDSYYLWPLINPSYHDDAASPSNYLNTIAAVVFVINALVCFVDWWLQFKQVSLCNMLFDENLTGGVHIADIPHKLQIYYFYNNLFFLGAAIIYMIQSIWYENPNSDLLDCNPNFCGVFWINFWGSMLYLLSSIFSCLETWENIKLREQQGLPPLQWVSCNIRDIDWFGWGDVLYLATSLVALSQVFLGIYWSGVTDDFINAYYLTQNWLFMFDSTAYFIGYIVFIYELRQTMVTGLMEARNAGTINQLIGDNYEVDPLLSSDGSAAPGGSTHGTDGEEQEEGGGGNRGSQAGGRDSVMGRASLFANAEGGRLTLQEVRYRLSEARNIRLRKTNERNSSAVISPIGRNTTGGDEVRASGAGTSVELSSVKK